MTRYTTNTVIVLTTRYATMYTTKYNTRFMGVLTKYFRLVEEKDKNGNTIYVTKIVAVVTTPYQPGRTAKPVLTDTAQIRKALKEITAK